MLLPDRRAAGRRLAERCEHLRPERPVVLGITRGGVPVARELAFALRAPFDVLVVRKIRDPRHPELDLGAVAEEGVVVRNDRTIAAVGADGATVDRALHTARIELDAAGARYRHGRPPHPLEHRCAVVVDDGLATGGTAIAAVAAARRRGAARVVLAVPVAAADAVARLDEHADEVIALDVPPVFHAVGEWYVDFSPTEDREVLDALDAGGAVTDGPEAVEIPTGTLLLPGLLRVPTDPIGAVAFAHGRGSDRHSSRNRWVAAVLEQAGFATLRFDLAPAQAAASRRRAFDLDELADHLEAGLATVARHRGTTGLPIGVFGASTGAAVALTAASRAGSPIRAIVSRGGRPDLATAALDRVQVPVLLIVGTEDEPVATWNRNAAARLRTEHRLVEVPGATHLFEEPGALDAVATLATEWFRTHLVAAVSPWAR